MGNLSRRFVEIEPPAAAPLKAAKLRPAARIIAGLKDALAFANGDETKGRLITPDPARLAAARKAAAEAEKPATKPRKRSNAMSNGQSNAEPAVSPKFDKRAYQRDLMRKRRAAAKTKAKA